MVVFLFGHAFRINYYNILIIYDLTLEIKVLIPFLSPKKYDEYSRKN